MKLFTNAENFVKIAEAKIFCFGISHPTPPPEEAKFAVNESIYGEKP